MCSTGQVLEMLEKGETPSNIRTDINDKPPNPAQPPPSSLLQPRPKPWESAHSPAAATNGGPPPANGGLPRACEKDDPVRV